MERKAVNQCPLCGGTVSMATYVRVWLSVNEDGSTDLCTDAKEIISDAVRTIENPKGMHYDAICDDCEAELKAKRLSNGNFEFSADI